MVDAEVRKVNNFVSVDGDTVKVNVMGKGYGANQPYFNKIVSIPKNKFLSWLRANLKNLIKINPWWIAFSAAMAAVGWAFDELLSQYTQLLTSPVGRCYSGSYLGTGYLYGSNMTIKQCAIAVMPSGGTYRSYSYV
uniref:hypothetical protein n=1 Tax=Aeromonas salmonicida TaxID=645 RepID=UPI0011CF48B3